VFVTSISSISRSYSIGRSQNDFHRLKASSLTHGFSNPWLCLNTTFVHVCSSPNIWGGAEPNKKFHLVGMV
jgi:hypothetical protein